MNKKFVFDIFNVCRKTKRKNNNTNAVTAFIKRYNFCIDNCTTLPKLKTTFVMKNLFNYYCFLPRIVEILKLPVKLNFLLFQIKSRKTTFPFSIKTKKMFKNHKPILTKYCK